MSASPAPPRAAAAANSTDNGRAPKLLQKLGRVNHLTAVSRAREGRGHHELASRASRRCRARHARGELNSWPVDLLFRLFYFVVVLFRLFYFVCSISFVLFLLVAAD